MKVCKICGETKPKFQFKGNVCNDCYKPMNAIRERKRRKRNKDKYSEF